MTPYRAAPPVVAQDAGTAFPRRNVGLFTGLVLALAAAALLLPTALLLGHARGVSAFREGGAGMFLLAALSLVVAGAIGLAGAFAVRGRPGWALAVVAAPLLPAILGGLLGALGMRRALEAVAASGVDLDVRMRILAVGLAESDVLPAYGLHVSAVGCGVAACALLASAASVDRTQHRAPAGNAWAAPAALGGLALIVTLVVHLVLRSAFGTLLLVVPSLLVLTTLASLAAVNAPLVRHWREPREADAWAASVVAAALLAALGFVLLEVGASYGSEARGLLAISGDALDPSQRARILGSVVEEQGNYRTIATVDALLALVLITSAGLAGLGRSESGRLRLPGGGPVLAALGGAVLIGATLLGTRAWELGQIAKAAGASGAADAADAKGAAGAAGAAGDDETSGALELPRVPVTERLGPSSSEGPVLRVDAHGKSTLRRARADALAATPSLLVVEADRRARWSDVANALRDTRKTQRVTSIELRVTLLDKADRSQLGALGPLLGNETSALRVALAAAHDGEPDDDEPFGNARRGFLETPMRPHDYELMDGIAAAIAKRPLGGARSGPAVTILPPEGTW